MDYAYLVLSVVLLFIGLNQEFPILSVLGVVVLLVFLLSDGDE